MVALVALLVVALVATVVAFLRHVEDMQARWALERRELLNRIQRPEIVPATPIHTYPVPDPEPDEIELVGTITFEPEE